MLERICCCFCSPRREEFEPIPVHHVPPTPLPPPLPAAPNSVLAFMRNPEAPFVVIPPPLSQYKIERIVHDGYNLSARSLYIDEATGTCCIGMQERGSDHFSFQVSRLIEPFSIIHQGSLSGKVSSLSFGYPHLVTYDSSHQNVEIIDLNARTKQELDMAEVDYIELNQLFVTQHALTFVTLDQNLRKNLCALTFNQAENGLLQRVNEYTNGITLLHNHLLIFPGEKGTLSLYNMSEQNPVRIGDLYLPRYIVREEEGKEGHEERVDSMVARGSSLMVLTNSALVTYDLSRYEAVYSVARPEGIFSLQLILDHGLLALTDNNKMVTLDAHGIQRETWPEMPYEREEEAQQHLPLSAHFQDHIYMWQSGLSTVRDFSCLVLYKKAE